MLEALALIICQPAIHDADSFVCADERENGKSIKIRLAGIAARETDGSCKPGHPCPDMEPAEAKAVLVDMLGGEVARWSTGHSVTAYSVQCYVDGQDQYGRKTGWCFTTLGEDINCTLIERGAALKWDKYWRGHVCGRQP